MDGGMSKMLDHQQVDYALDKIIGTLLRSPFWQSVAGQYLGSWLFSLPIGATMAYFLKVILRQVWTWRRGFVHALIFSCFVFFSLLAVRFTISGPQAATIAKINALSSQNVKLQSAVEALQPRHLGSHQSKMLASALGVGPDIGTRLLIATYPDCFECRAYAWDFAITMNAIPQWGNSSIGVLPYPQQLSTLWHGVIVIAQDPKAFECRRKGSYGCSNWGEDTVFLRSWKYFSFEGQA